jgi:hypothetical protein
MIIHDGVGACLASNGDAPQQRYRLDLSSSLGDDDNVAVVFGSNDRPPTSGASSASP